MNCIAIPRPQCMERLSVSNVFKATPLFNSSATSFLSKNNDFRRGKNFRQDMCGFCGVLNTDRTVEASLISSMLRPLAKRGPDACGVCLQDMLAFGHRRLSILDLTPASQQPMVDPQL